MNLDPALPRSGLREPHTLGDIVGQPAVVEGLRRRVLTPNRAAGVILYGPAGVGKRTLGRLHSKALLCDRPNDAGDSCGRCEACDEFDLGSTIECITVDISLKDAENSIEYVMERIRYRSWKERRVVTLINADRAVPKVFDRLLPTLERTGTSTVFILLACDLKRIRLAGVSRCDRYQVRPLTPDITRGLLATRFAELGKMPDEETLDMLVAAGRGLPEQLDEICARLVGIPDLTLASARQALALDWADHAVLYFRSYLAGEVPTADALASSTGVDQAEVRRRTGALLTQLYLCEQSGGSMKAAAYDPALTSLDEMLLRGLARELKRCAAMQGVTAETFWAMNVQQWLSDDLIDRG